MAWKPKYAKCALSENVDVLLPPVADVSNTELSTFVADAEGRHSEARGLPHSSQASVPRASDGQDNALRANVAASIGDLGRSC